MDMSPRFSSHDSAHHVRAHSEVGSNRELFVSGCRSEAYATNDICRNFGIAIGLTDRATHGVNAAVMRSPSFDKAWFAMRPVFLSTRRYPITIPGEGASALGCHVSTIALGVTNPEMRRVDTGRIVATVTDVSVLWNGAMVQDPRCPMRKRRHPSAVGQRAIARLVPSASPLPAVSNQINSSPKAYWVPDRFRHMISVAPMLLICH